MLQLTVPLQILYGCDSYTLCLQMPCIHVSVSDIAECYCMFADILADIRGIINSAIDMDWIKNVTFSSCICRLFWRRSTNRLANFSQLEHFCTLTEVATRADLLVSNKHVSNSVMRLLLMFV